VKRVCLWSCILPALWLAGTPVLQGGSDSFLIAGLRVMPDRWNKEANLQKLDHWAREAARQGAKLVITPEGFLEGYVANSSANPGVTEDRYRSVGESIDGPLLLRIRSLAGELKIYLLVGFAESRGGKMFNSAVIFSPEGKVALHYSKSHNAHDEPFNTKGTEFPVADTGLGRLGALICYDRQLPETSRILAIKGAQMILVPAWGAHGEMNEVMMRTRAYENSVYVAFVHPEGIVAKKAESGSDKVRRAHHRIESLQVAPLSWRDYSLVRTVVPEVSDLICAHV
jgi:predicted amidohydrolase